jgi:hypothetical protein
VECRFEAEVESGHGVYARSGLLFPGSSTHTSYSLKVLARSRGVSIQLRTAFLGMVDLEVVFAWRKTHMSVKGSLSDRLRFVSGSLTVTQDPTCY